VVVGATEREEGSFLMHKIGRIACLAGALGLVAFASGAHAQDPPRLVGTWKATAYAVHIGSNPYRAAEKNGPNLPSNGIELTYTISEQQGNRFAGTSTNGKFTETLIGAIHPDNRSGIILDDDGEYTFTIRDPDTIDACYRHSFPTSRVAGCWSLKRSAP
jgi:hypothetical protein